jgi:O-antigen/teichoic acid export membrane protein
LTLLAVGLIPTLFAARLGGHVREAQWVIFLLGISLVIQFLFSVFTGVITGCHRWGLHNAISAGSYGVAVVGMISVVLAGGGLRWLAAMSLMGEVIAALARFVAARRVCPELHLSRHQMRLKHAGEMLRFGGKSLLGSVGELLLYKTTNLIILGFLGPAAIALYARPASLVSQVTSLINKFAFVLTPTASALHSKEDLSALREMWIKAGTYSLYISLPMVLVLAVAGGAVLELWMGLGYRNSTLIAVLALGHLAYMHQRTSYQVLVGLGRHGFPALVMVAVAVCAAGLSLLFLGPLHLGLVSVALAVTMPLTVANLFVVPAYACRIMQMSYLQYVRRTMTKPILATAPLGVCLLGARHVLPGNGLAGLSLGLACGGAITAVIYWMYVLPEGLRQKLVRCLPWRRLPSGSGRADPLLASPPVVEVRKEVP